MKTEAVSEKPSPASNGGIKIPQPPSVTPQMRAEDHIRRILGDKDLQIAVLRAQLDEANEKIKALET